tara:strand:- start:176 stop:862 length:687 start_codon:yes stop_codon:yes gene_type:complete
MYNTLKITMICAISTIFLIGCSTTQRTTQSKRTAVEQLLIAESITRSLPKKLFKPLPIPHGSTITLNTSGHKDRPDLTPDHDLLQEILAGWLGQQGYLIKKNSEVARYQADIIVSAIGTEENTSFVGIPPVNSQIIPFSLPELAAYKAKNQTGYVKFSINFFEISTGKFVGSSSNFIADSYHNYHTILLLLSFSSTNLMSPPKLGIFNSRPQNTGDIKYKEKPFFDWW